MANWKHDAYFKSEEMFWNDKVLGLRLEYKGAYPTKMFLQNELVYDKTHLSQWFKEANHEKI